jgi:hypothetical protein
MLAVAFEANKTVYVRCCRYGTRPERLGREIPLDHRDLPMTGIMRQYLANSLRRHAAAPMFSRYEELRHVVLDASPWWERVLIKAKPTSHSSTRISNG